MVLDSKMRTGRAQRSMVDRFADFSTPPSRATLSRFVSQVPRRMKASRHRGWGEAGGGGGRSVTVFHAGRGRRTPKIGACARACMSVQDARRCSRYTPTSLCSPVTFAEAVFSPSPPLPSPSSTASSLLPSRRYPPIPLLFSSLLFFPPSLYFQPFFFFFLLLWPHASKILLYLVSIGRQRESGEYFARVYFDLESNASKSNASERGASDCSRTFLRGTLVTGSPLPLFYSSSTSFPPFWRFLRDLRGTVRSLGKGFFEGWGERFEGEAACCFRGLSCWGGRRVFDKGIWD